MIPPNEDRRTWYLVLQIGFPTHTGNRRSRLAKRLSSFENRAAARHLKIVRTECKTIGVSVRHINVAIENNRDEFGHYLFRFRRFKRDDIAAMRLAESLAYGFSAAGGSVIDTSRPLLLRVPDTLISGKRAITIGSLVALEESRPWRERIVRVPSASAASEIAGTTIMITAVHEAAWRIAAVAFDNPAFFDAIRFLRRSHENFYVYPGGIDEVLYEADFTPLTGTLQSRFEEALQNAFKAIEAVIGDPPKDDRRFFAKLAAIGIDPNEEAGYLEKVPIAQIVRKMNEARDKRAAHGSTRNRSISAAELLDFQTCAETIVLAALEMKRGSPLE